MNVEYILQKGNNIYPVNQQMLEFEQGAMGDPMAEMGQEEGAPAPQPQNMPKENEGEI